MIFPYQPKRCVSCGRKLPLKPAEQTARDLTPAQVAALRYTLAHPKYNHFAPHTYDHYGLPGTRTALEMRGLTVWHPGPTPPMVTPLGLAVLECLADTPQTLKEVINAV